MNRFYIPLYLVLSVLISNPAAASQYESPDSSPSSAASEKLVDVNKAFRAADEVIKHFKVKAPNLDALLEANATLAKEAHISPFKALEFALRSGLTKQFPTKALSVYKYLKAHFKKTGMTMTAGDHFLLSHAYVNEASDIMDVMYRANKSRAAILAASANATDKSYKHLLLAVKDPGELTQEERLLSFRLLSSTAFEKQHYQECIRFSEQYLDLNRQLGLIKMQTKQEGGNHYKQTPFFLFYSFLAQSYYFCNRFEDAVKTYLVLYEDRDAYVDSLKKMRLDELKVLFWVYFSVQDTKTQEALEALINNTVPNMSKEAMRDLSALVAQSNILKQTAPVKARQHNNRKPNKKPGVKKEDRRAMMRAHFVSTRTGQIEDACSKIIAGCTELVELVTQYELDIDHTTQSGKLSQLCQETLKNVTSLKGKSDVNSVSKVNALYTEVALKGNEQLKNLKQAIKAQVSSRLKARQSRSVPSANEVDSHKTNLKHEVLAAHKQAGVKEKTRGEANPPVVTERTISNKDKEEDDNDNKLGNIHSCSDEVAFILDTQRAWDLPDNSVECLNILKNAHSIQELIGILKTRNAKIKMLRGKNEGTWQFRVNDKIRIRFNVVHGRFANVQIGDFH